MTSTKDKLVPVIAGQWRLLYKPQRTGCYVNDHCLILSGDRDWHLFGITRDEPEPKPEKERWFTHGKGKLVSETGMKELGIVCDNGTRAWAPAVVWDGRRYYMYYGPSPLRMAVSDELSHWMEWQPVISDCPPDACHRDPMVLRLSNGKWLMYASGLEERRGAICVLESNDLLNWRFAGYALRSSGTAPLSPPWGAMESPFVVFHGGWYYLFVTYTDCKTENYHNTLVFRSSDPLDFGEYSGENDAQVVARLHAHAPEVVCDDSGQWHITTCGWRGKGTPIEGGVAIAPLEWQTVQTSPPSTGLTSG